MGCNAYNHAVNCNCGWGGDTGGGRGRWAGSALRSPVVDGFTWRFDRKPTYDSFVNPNATCPVCGASVYFYQSPYGGRVFFDELGPPWPKHPCTDNGPSGGGGQRTHDIIFAPATTQASKTPPLYARDAWRPLLAEELTRVGECDRIRMPRRERMPGRYIYVPAGWTGDAPAYWRWSRNDAGSVELSCIRVKEQGVLETRTFNVPGWLHNDEEFEQWRADPNLDLAPRAMNAIGFSLSFAWRSHDRPFWHVGLPCIDFDVARPIFDTAI
jgi:hypothetical protein